jgi:alkaline phosphatase
LKFRFLKKFCVLLAVVVLAGCAAVGPRPAGREAPVRFGIVTDAHYADIDPRGKRFYRESMDKMAACVDRMNLEKVDFLAELGDFKDMDDPPVEAKTLSYLRTIESVFAGFRGPRYHALGNHDMDSLAKVQVLEMIENTGISKDRSYFAFEVRGLQFLVLDANYTSAGAPYDRGNFAWADCNIPAAELEWLTAELTRSPKPAIILLHQQLDGVGDYFVKNAPDVRRILERSGRVRAVFQGHRHEGMFTRISGIPYYTLKGMIEGSGPENNAWAIVQVSSGGDIEVSGFLRADSRTLPRER